MTDLSVDTDGLRTLSSALENVRRTLDATRRTVAAAREDLGSAVVHGALEDFERGWADGRGRIDTNASAMGEILEESAAAYDATDAALRDRLS